ncbi:MAG: ATP-grasp domain-containing protein [Myxococcota bacterium]
MKTVAVISAGADDTAQGVQRALERLGARVVSVDTSLVPERVPLSLEGGRVIAAGVSLSDVRAVYVKSLHLAVPLYDVESLSARAPKAWPARWVAERERHALLTSAFRALELSGAHLVNPVSRFEWHLLKPLQTEVLARARVPVPATLATCDPDAVRAFVERHGDVIYKPIAGGALVRRLEARDVSSARLSRLSTAPVLFQQRIPGEEWRVYVLDGEVVSAFALPARGVVDAREVLQRAKRKKAPRAVAEVSCRAARALGLVFTAVDVRLDDEGAPYVLECNPTPSVSFYEKPESSPVLRALAAHLVRHA